MTMDKIDDIFEQSFPEYQATWMKGEVNFTVRKSDPKDAVDGIKAMIQEWESWVGAQGEKSALRPTTSVGNTMKCPECGSEMVAKSGTSKTGKPWQGNFCTQCKFVKWL